MCIVVGTFISVFLTMNICEYHTYNKNFNKKISSVLNTIKDKYPDVSEEELIEVLYSTEDDKNILEKYNIDIDIDSLIGNNGVAFRKHLAINIVFYMFTIGLMLFFFLSFNKKKDREINKITKCIEEINRKNYALDLDSMSEDELSILKNEIYKTTIMLKEAAENSNKEKLQLKDSLSDISHQLKTPLTSILITLDNIIDDPEMDSDIREEFVRNIKREINSISFLVQSILKLSKLDTNTINFIIEDAEKLITEAIKNVSMLSDLRSVDIRLEIKDNPLIKCDAKWQIEAISNILKDCVEHSESESHVDVEVTDNKVYSKIAIRDYGKGIDKEDLPHIFERFYKGKNATSDSVGIGLSLAKSIIEKDNGTVSAESDEKGTQFIIKYFK